MVGSAVGRGYAAGGTVGAVVMGVAAIAYAPVIVMAVIEDVEMLISAYEAVNDGYNNNDDEGVYEDNSINDGDGYDISRPEGIPDDWVEKPSKREEVKYILTLTILIIVLELCPEIKIVHM